MMYILILVTCLSTGLGAVAPKVAAPEAPPAAPEAPPAAPEAPPAAPEALPAALKAPPSAQGGPLADKVPSQPLENDLLRSSIPEVVFGTFLNDVVDVWDEPALDPETYIIGGHDARPGAWPWQASLRHQGKHRCGGVVIGPRWVLTSAECLSDIRAQPTVILGLHDQRQASKLQEHAVTNITVHGSYTSQPNPQNDLALLQLDEEAALNTATVDAVELPRADQNFPRPSTCYITGWGRGSRFFAMYPNVLQEAKIKVFDNNRCRRAWRWFGKRIHPTNICVGRYLRESSCAGDEGGPLVCQVGGGWKLAGVASWTTQFCPSVMPSVYTRVTEYRQWIADVSGL